MNVRRVLVGLTLRFRILCAGVVDDAAGFRLDTVNMIE